MARAKIITSLLRLKVVTNIFGETELICILETELICICATSLRPQGDVTSTCCQNGQPQPGRICKTLLRLKVVTEFHQLFVSYAITKSESWEIQSQSSEGYGAKPDQTTYPEVRDFHIFQFFERLI